MVSIDIKISFALKEIKVTQCIKAEYLDCKVLSAMRRQFIFRIFFLLESNPFEPELFRFNLDFIGSDN